MKGFLSHANDDPYKNVRISKVLLLVHTHTKAIYNTFDEIKQNQG